MSVSMVTTTSAIAMGKAATMPLCIKAGILTAGANTMTKEKRYRESGITHKRGTGVMSVVINAVTPSIRLEGTKASAIHLSLLIRVSPPLKGATSRSPSPATAGAPAPAGAGGGGASSNAEEASGVVVEGAGEERHSTTAEANTKTTKTTYPTDHIAPWFTNLKEGSTKSRSEEHTSELQ